MNHMSNEGLSGAVGASTVKTAQVIPFERPPTDVQRALQERAQTLMDLDRERRATKPEPLKWGIMLLLALVPVLFLLTAVDAFVRVFHHVNAMYMNMPAPEAPAQEAGPAPVMVSDEPGVVLLQPLNEQANAPSTVGDSAEAPTAEARPD
jgi:hypothetical protein